MADVVWVRAPIVGVVGDGVEKMTCVCFSAGGRETVKRLNQSTRVREK